MPKFTIYGNRNTKTIELDNTKSDIGIIRQIATEKGFKKSFVAFKIV